MLGRTRWRGVSNGPLHICGRWSAAACRRFTRGQFIGAAILGLFQRANSRVEGGSKLPHSKNGFEVRKGNSDALHQARRRWNAELELGIGCIVGAVRGLVKNRVVIGQKK